MTVLATYQSQEMGVKATVKTADHIFTKVRKYGFLVSIEDTDADEVVGIKLFNVFEAADEYAKKCVVAQIHPARSQGRANFLNEGNL